MENYEKINNQDSIIESTSTKRESINDIESNTDSHLESHTTKSSTNNTESNSKQRDFKDSVKSCENTDSHLESSTTESNKNNTDSKKLDSDGDEIIWEIKPKYYFINTFTHITILIFCIIALCMGIFADIFTTLAKIVWSIFFGFAIYQICNILLGMVCFYVTNNGIGFERRHWFRIQKRFFKFGEVEASIGEYQVFVLYNHNEIFITPLNAKGWYRRKNTYRLHFLNFNLSTDKKIYEIWDFIRKKSKIALESKGIDTHSINLNTLFICFIKE